MYQQQQQQLQLQPGTLESPEAVHLSAFQALSQEISPNEYGLLPYYLRADLIPLNYNALEPEQRAHFLSLARSDLIYSDGFPTTQEGTVFWERLPQESHADYWMFEKYLSMASQYGYRSIQLLARALAQEHGHATQHTKAIAASNEFMDVEVSTAQAEQTVLDADALVRAQQDYIRKLYVYYYWSQRATSYDRVGAAATRKIRASRAIQLEDRHYGKLEKITEKLFKRFEGFTEDDLDKLEAPDIMKMLKDAIQLQRVTVGLPAAAPAGEHLPGVKDNDASIPMEAHLRHISRSHDNIAQGGQAAEGALNNEEIAEAAQEVIIKIMRSKQA